MIHGKINLGDKNEVFDAELLYLAKALEEAFVHALETHDIHHVHMFLENQSAIRATYDALPLSSQHITLQLRNDIYSFLDNNAATT